MTQRPIPPADVRITSERMERDWYDFFRDRLRFDLSPLTYGTLIKTNCLAGENFLIAITNNTAFTIDKPINPVRGMVISYMLKNTSGGASGAITWNSVFHFVGGAAPAAPANNNNRTIGFVYDGASWLERFRSAGDVPN